MRLKMFTYRMYVKPSSYDLNPYVYSDVSNKISSSVREEFFEKIMHLYIRASGMIVAIKGARYRYCSEYYGMRFPYQPDGHKLNEYHFH